MRNKLIEILDKWYIVWIVKTGEEVPVALDQLNTGKMMKETQSQ